MRRFSFLLASFLSVSGFSIGSAQEHSARPILIGPTVSFEPALEHSTLPVYNGSNDCGTFTSGFSTTPAAGGYFLLPELFSPNVGFAGRIAFNSTSSRLTATPVDPQRMLDNSSMQLVDLQREYRMTSTLQLLSFDLLVRLKMGGHLSLGFGPTLGYRLSGKFMESDNLLGPGNTRFADGSSEHSVFNGTTTTANALAFGAVAVGSYSLPVGEKAMLVPELAIRINLGSPVKEGAWQQFGVSGGLSLLFDVTPSEKAPAPAPTSVPTPPVPMPVRKPVLATSIQIFGIDSAGQRLPAAIIKVDEVVERQHAPTVPVIFFEENSSDIPARYVRQTKEQASLFSYDALAKSDPLEAYHQALNVLGLRMKNDPQTHITLHGLASSNEAAPLGIQRAEHVRKYLTDIWGIESSRIEVKTGTGLMPRSNEATNDGQSENRRVEISSSSAALSEPVSSETHVRTFDPPKVKILPVYQAEAGIETWEMAIEQRGKVVVRYTSSDAGPKPFAEKPWQIDASKIDTSISPLVARITITDSAGQTSTASADVPLVTVHSLMIVDKTTEKIGEHEKIAYELVGFDYNSAQLGTRHDAILNQLVAVVKPGAKVTVTGYTDRMGEEQHNLDLSRQRAEKVAQSLNAMLRTRGIADVTVTTAGVGIDTGRFPNDLPEGRVLSRGVSVVVDQGGVQVPASKP